MTARMERGDVSRDLEAGNAHVLVGLKTPAGGDAGAPRLFP